MCRASPAGLLVASDLIARYKIYLLLIPRVHVASSKLVSFFTNKILNTPSNIAVWTRVYFLSFFRKKYTLQIAILVHSLGSGHFSI